MYCGSKCAGIISVMGLLGDEAFFKPTRTVMPFGPKMIRLKLETGLRS